MDVIEPEFPQVGPEERERLIDFRRKMAQQGWLAWHGDTTGGPMKDPMERAQYVAYAMALQEVHAQLMALLVGPAPGNRAVEHMVAWLILHGERHGVERNVTRGMYPLVIPAEASDPEMRSEKI